MTPSGPAFGSPASRPTAKWVADIKREEADRSGKCWSGENIRDMVHRLKPGSEQESWIGARLRSPRGTTRQSLALRDRRPVIPRLRDHLQRVVGPRPRGHDTLAGAPSRSALGCGEDQQRCCHRDVQALRSALMLDPHPSRRPAASSASPCASLPSTIATRPDQSAVGVAVAAVRRRAHQLANRPRGPRRALQSRPGRGTSAPALALHDLRVERVDRSRREHDDVDACCF